MAHALTDANTTNAFDIALKAWLKRAQAIVDVAYGDSVVRPVLVAQRGKKNVKIVRTEYGSQGGSVFCFVEIATGNVLKAASWQAPAKHARGSIYGEGNEGVSAYGANYLR